MRLEQFRGGYGSRASVIITFFVVFITKMHGFGTFLKKFLKIFRHQSKLRAFQRAKP